MPGQYACGSRSRTSLSPLRGSIPYWAFLPGATDALPASPCVLRCDTSGVVTHPRQRVADGRPATALPSRPSARYRCRRRVHARAIDLAPLRGLRHVSANDREDLPALGESISKLAKER